MGTVTALVARGMGFALYVVGGWALVTQLAAGGVPAPAVAAQRPAPAALSSIDPGVDPSAGTRAGAAATTPPDHRGTDVVLALSRLDDPTTLSCATTADRVSTDVLVVHNVEVPVLDRELGCTPGPSLPEALSGATP